LVWPIPAGFSPLEVAVHFREAFDAAERLLLDTLAAEHVEFAEFDRSVMELATFLEHPSGHPLRLSQSATEAVCSNLSQPWCLPLRSAADLAVPALQILGRLLGSGAGACWWTDGSAVVEPSWLITPSLPSGAQYSGMLAGGWAQSGWRVEDLEGQLAPGTVTLEPAVPEDLLIVSGAHSDRGPVRSSNQDAFIDRPDLRLWAVADGIGGMSDGDVASRMTCDALGNVVIAADLDQQVEGIVSQLTEVNSYLRRAAVREVNPVQSGSTVVTVVIRQQRFAALWAGDSRVYRLRGGVLSQLTRDHVFEAEEPSEEPAVTTPESQAITRAVGGEDELIPDSVRGEVSAGDRFLLCTDGLYRTLDEGTLTSILAAQEPAATSKELVTQAIARGSTDNVTALVIDCSALVPVALTDALNIRSLQPPA
jgi:serine/threonine protein phosphatase PrpC